MPAQFIIINGIEYDAAACCGRYLVSQPGARCATGQGCRKPHLRLHYSPPGTKYSPKLNEMYPASWSIELTNPGSGAARTSTFKFPTSSNALSAARIIWWGY